MTSAWLRRLGLAAAMVLGLGAGWVSSASAADYVLGPEDVISISVWLHPELERTLTINADGNITLAPVGEIKAAGLSPKQLGDKIADRLSAYLRQTTTTTVTVVTYVSRSVFVTGAVAKPGRYGFERIPTLIDVLGQAGGATTGADLSAVQILRKEGDARRTVTADLSNALRTGDASGLPELKAGDTIVIPGPANGSSAAAGEGVGVLGEVGKPGLYGVGAGQDLWAVLALAGGLTARGNLADVRVLTRTEGGLNVAQINLRAALDHGSRAPITVKAGDVVVVMPRGPNLWTGLVSLLSLSQNALNAAVLVDYLHNRKVTN